MKKRAIISAVVAAATGFAITTPAQAQAAPAPDTAASAPAPAPGPFPALKAFNYELYGVVDDGFVWTNNRSGSAPRYFRQGSLIASKFGIRGALDFGNARTSGIFDLQAGFDPNNGTQATANSIFNRAAWVGLKDTQYGQITLGRQYTPYFQFVGTLSGTPAYYLTGATGAHPGDYDGLDTTIRVNNSAFYVSPTVGGFTAGAEYALGQIGNSQSSGSTYSAAFKYAGGPLTAAVGYLRLNNTNLVAGAFDPAASGSFTTSVINQGYVSAKNITHIAGAFNYTIGDLVVGANATQVSYDPGAKSLFTENQKLRSIGALAMYKLTPQFDFAGDMSITKASKANGITDPATYSALAARQTYHFTKAISFYALEAMQHASGLTLGKKGAGNIVTAQPAIGDSQNTTPSTTPRQYMLDIGVAVVF